MVPPPPPQLIAGDLEYEVEQVIDYDTGRKKYLVKWLGYGHESNTWEPEKNLKHSADLIQGYWEATKLIEQHRAGGSRQGGRDKPEGTEKAGPQNLRTSRRIGQTPNRYRV